MKKKLLLIVLPIFLFSCSSNEYAPPGKTTQSKENVKFGGDFKIEKTGYGAWEISGILENISGRELSMVGVTIPICDASGAKISEAADLTSGLEAGQRWRFRAPVIENQWKVCTDASPTITAF